MWALLCCAEVGGYSVAVVQALIVAWAQYLWLTGSEHGLSSWAHGLSRSLVHRIFRTGWNPCPLYWQAAS